MRVFRTLLVTALGLTFIVVVVGAYVRLSDAGLGCPDWPFCYGRPIPGGIADGDALAKAWKEMGHRYLAGTLGVLLVAIALLAWKLRQSPWPCTGLVALVVFQATLGMWTVTLLLKPVIVTAHLLGGMAILGLLVWLVLSQSRVSQADYSSLRGPALFGLAVVAVQIALGGWVSANYAALACPDLPLCRGAFVPPMDFGNAFHVLRELGQTPEGTALSQEALTAIQWSHRMFALVVVAVLCWVAAKVFRVSKPMALLIAALLVLQFSLGVANVWLRLPLLLAAAHNAGAALLFASLVVLNFFAFRKLAAS
jgi:cytochrome c oxidase assembly protein subunit 15